MKLDKEGKSVAYFGKSSCGCCTSPSGRSTAETENLKLDQRGKSVAVFSEYRITHKKYVGRKFDGRRGYLSGISLILTSCTLNQSPKEQGRASVQHLPRPGTAILVTIDAIKYAFYSPDWDHRTHDCGIESIWAYCSGL